MAGMVRLGVLLPALGLLVDDDGSERESSGDVPRLADPVNETDPPEDIESL